VKALSASIARSSPEIEPDFIRPFETSGMISNSPLWAARASFVCTALTRKGPRPTSICIEM
jgi:hypothetical protein